MMFFFVVGFFALLAGGFFGLKKEKKKALISLAVVAVSFVLMVVTLPEATILTINTETIETNEVGLAEIEGETNTDASLTIDGESVSTDEGKFSHSIQLNDAKDKKVTITTKYNKENVSKTVKIKASKAYAKLLKEEEEELAEKIALEKAEKEAETAIILAEEKPNQENYDEAFTLVKSLSLANSSFEKRLVNVYQTIKVETAEKALTTAESKPTKENYEAAKLAITEVPEQSETLTNRLVNVNNVIIAAENAAKEKAAKEKELAQAQEQAANQAAATNTQENTVVSQMVLVTPTGEKYHSYKCGNGTYTEATLDAAIARGLSPCSKCF